MVKDVSVVAKGMVAPFEPCLDLVEQVIVADGTK
jgi:hypothetical protein